MSKKKQPKHHSREEIELALTCFCLEAGRRKPTEKLLRDAGLKVNWNTLTHWAYNSQHELYEQISTEVEQQVKNRLSDQFHRLARRSGELVEETLDRIDRTLKESDAEMQAVDERLAEIASDPDAADERRTLYMRRKQAQTSLKELAKLLHEGGLLSGVATEKLQLVSGRPTAIVDNDFGEIRRALEGKGVRLVVGAEAQQLGQPAAALPEGEPDG